MSQLFAYVANDSERARCALYPVRQVLRAGGEVDGWGVGCHQGGEVLLKRRPRPEHAVDFFDVVSELKSDVIVGQVRTHRFGKNNTDNTPPFRFRSWLFAYQGVVPGYAELRERIIARVPDFLRRSIIGESPAEVLFHLILGGLRPSILDDPNVPASEMKRALETAIGYLGDISAPHGKLTEGTFVLTNGRSLVALDLEESLSMHTSTSLLNCAVCREHAPQAALDRRRVDHEHLRSVLILSQPTEVPVGTQWQSIAPRTAVLVSHTVRTTLESIAL